MIEGKSRKLAGIASIFVSLAFFAGIGIADAAEFTGEEVIPLINQSRSEAGASALLKNAKLTQAATAKANDMFKRQYFAHVGPDGNGPSYWIDQAGYDWTAIGENIAYGYKTAASVHEGFMNSAGHRKNILNSKYEHVGVAAVGGTYQGRSLMMVVEEFGASNDPAEDSTGETPEATTYALTIEGGSGSGNYAAGSQVTIIAAAPETGKAFNEWTGDAEAALDAKSASTTVTMPSSAITLTATYIAAEDTTGGTTGEQDETSYALTITDGSGSGSYEEGQTVTITADAPGGGKVFHKWTGDAGSVSDVTAATATVTMPGSNVNLTATYKAERGKKGEQTGRYYLKVEGGSGDGWYAAGDTVTITADAPKTGKVFHKWTGRTADAIIDASASTTTFTMPERNVSLTARYRSAATTRQKKGTMVKTSVNHIMTFFGCH